MISRRVFCSILVAGAALTPTLAQAQNYPTRSIRLLVPYAAGGGTDAIARLVAHGVGEKLGQTMVIETTAQPAGTWQRNRRPAPLPTAIRC